MVASNSRRLHSVEASSPKKTLRMLLSMPTIRYFLALKNRTASAPIKPAEPVISAIFIARPQLTFVEQCSEGFQGDLLPASDAYRLADPSFRSDFSIFSSGRSNLRLENRFSIGQFLPSGALPEKGKGILQCYFANQFFGVTAALHLLD